MEKTEDNLQPMVVVTLERHDDAVALAKALKELGGYAGIGGDCEMFATMSDGDPKSMGRIGHDVIIRKVEVLG